MRLVTHPTRALSTAIIGLVLLPGLARAQLNCGSTGASGALNVPSGQTVTLNVPNNGIFNFTTVTVSGTLQFTRNAAYNPPVYLLATGDVVVSGRINVFGSDATAFTGGAGGPGGFDGGSAGIAGAEAGAGHGPGSGGKGTAAGGNAAYGGVGLNYTGQQPNGSVYGSPLLVPLVGGSGGGGRTNRGGGGGGGALLLCSPSQIIMNGTLNAVGGGDHLGGGSGGAVRIVAPAVKGSGAIDVRGGNTYGGPGRVRIDLIDRSELSLDASPATSLSVGSLLAVFSSTVPQLDIVRVAGSPIPVGTASPLVFTLPFNAVAQQAITVRATNFTGIVPIAVVITPDSGDRIVINTQINADVQPAETTVNVNLPQNIAVRVHAWTR